jgi:hypothetical protein
MLSASALPRSAPQYQTEQFFIDEGMLMPKFHKNYWMGLRTTNDEWPTFK